MSRNYSGLMTNKILLGTITIAFIAGTIISPSLASAHVNVCKGSVNAKPFLELWAAVCDLQNQIDHIQLIPGPQGPIGPAGPRVQLALLTFIK